MRIFITGATGYIGMALAKRLSQRSSSAAASESGLSGYELRALVRASSRPERVRALEAMGVVTYVGDIGDRESMREPMSDADWVIHAAAEVNVWSSDEAMHKANLEGSESIASLAHELEVGRFLSISSIAFFGGSPEDGSLATEEAPLQKPFPTAYSATKHAGEMAIRAWADRGLSLNTVYPSLVYGPPGKRGGANGLLRTLGRGKMPFLVGADRRASWVYLEDLVDGILRVVDRAEAGRDYILAGEVATVREVADRIAELSGVPAPKRSIPIALARSMLTVFGPIAKLLGRRPPVPPAQLATLSRHWAFDDSRARRELDWTPRSLVEGLPPTLTELLGFPTAPTAGGET